VHQPLERPRHSRVGQGHRRAPAIGFRQRQFVHDNALAKAIAQGRLQALQIDQRSPALRHEGQPGLAQAGQHAVGLQVVLQHRLPGSQRRAILAADLRKLVLDCRVFLTDGVQPAAQGGDGTIRRGAVKFQRQAQAGDILAVEHRPDRLGKRPRGGDQHGLRGGVDRA